jgi:hypothetical protein
MNHSNFNFYDAFDFDDCCYPIFDPYFDKFTEKTKNSKKTMKTPKNAFLIYLHRF